MLRRLSLLVSRRTNGISASSVLGIIFWKLVNNHRLMIWTCFAFVARSNMSNDLVSISPLTSNPQCYSETPALVHWHRGNENGKASSGNLEVHVQAITLALGPMR